MILLAILAGCDVGASEQDATPATDSESAAAMSVEADAPGVIRVSAEEYGFNARSKFPSGWVDLKFENEGEEEHFLLIWRLPEGKIFDDYAAEVAEPFQRLYTRYRAGELDQAEFFEELTAAIPEWFFEAVPMGGPGFTSPGRTSETLIYLEPGENYVIECYVRSMQEDDRFHGSEGMLRPLVVTEEASGLEPPEHDVDIAISNSGLTVTGDLSAGSHMVRVRVEETPDGFVRHNVHLVRLEDDVSVKDGATWLNWVDAMVPPAPVEFLGGAGQTAAGRESYVAVDLEPGRYAWVSEMRGIDGFVHEFTVE